MADGFRVDFEGDLARLIDRRVSETGLSREDLVRHAVEQTLFRCEDYTWIGDDPRTTPAEPFDPAAPTLPWEEVEARLRTRLADRLALKA